LLPVEKVRRMTPKFSERQPGMTNPRLKGKKPVQKGWKHLRAQVH
jgi:ribosomal protein S30